MFLNICTDGIICYSEVGVKKKLVSSMCNHEKIELQFVVHMQYVNKSTTSIFLQLASRVMSFSNIILW